MPYVHLSEKDEQTLKAMKEQWEKDTRACYVTVNPRLHGFICDHGLGDVVIWSCPEQGRFSRRSITQEDWLNASKTVLDAVDLYWMARGETTLFKFQSTAFADFLATQFSLYYSKLLTDRYKTTF